MPHAALRPAPTAPRPPGRRPSTRGRLPRYELTGPAHAPIVIAVGGISAHAHVTATDLDPSPGWWSGVIGEGKAIDTRRYQVLGVDFLDGGRDDAGRPRYTVTTHDQADAIVRVLDAIGAPAVHAFVGASYGGMVGLAFAERHPHRLAKLVAISAPHEAHPMTTARRALQRNIVKLGLESGRVRESLALARGLAMTTYRSAREFGERFERAPLAHADGDAVFPVEQYLAEHGGRFAAQWSPARFLALSLSGDLHRVDPAAVRTPTVIVAAEDDAVVPAEQLETLAAAIAAPTRLVHLPSRRGHDAFLTEPDALGDILAVAVATTIVS